MKKIDTAKCSITKTQNTIIVYSRIIYLPKTKSTIIDLNRVYNSKLSWYNFKDIFLSAIKWTIVLEFVVNLYSFSLFTEIIILPVLVLLAMTQAVAERDEKHKVVSDFLQYLIAIAGFLIFGYMDLYYIVNLFLSRCCIAALLNCFRSCSLIDSLSDSHSGKFCPQNLFRIYFSIGFRIFKLFASLLYMNIVFCFFVLI